MITTEEMKSFLDWKVNSKSRVLSVYLAIEPSGEAAFHRRFELTFKALMLSLKNEIRVVDEEGLHENINFSGEFLSSLEPSSPGLVMFADESRDFIWTKELHFPVVSQAYWLEKPYLLPLLEALDEYKRCGVILADKRRARILTYHLGEVEEEKGTLAWNDTQHIRTSGKDNLRSAFKLQRTAEMHKIWHLKHAAEIMENLNKRYPFDRLILSGPEDIVHELEEVLPRDLQSKAAGKLSCPVDVHEKDLEHALLQIEKSIEQNNGKAILEKILHENPAHPQRVIGLEAVLWHLDKGSIYKIIYSENYKPRGCKCPQCGYLFSAGRMMCGRCNSSVSELPYLLEEMARSVAQKGGFLEEIKGDAAIELDKAGGVGALLKPKLKR